ncbi:orotidine-5'-phosphate decarboxylase [Nesterenkonia sp. F]|uniref:orotidine-5'-phosphate decarboxylase n=1 Tax=Nesterenkonia sp. F TaxID=795955 RepID=UPI00052674C9|nr:orotidine-5'-phosphate decarboxylase [Nesterenkonia sp. F]
MSGGPRPPAASPGRGARPGFGERLSAAMAASGRLCVGIDPHAELLAAWGLSDDAEGLRAFGERVVAAAAGVVGVVKPQAAFFERHGPAGMQALAEVQRSAREAGLLVIADAKRGDIGSTMAGYADAWLDPDAPLAADALTVSPYLGVGALAPAVQSARIHGAGLFVLGLTSNPEGRDVQLVRSASGATVAGEVAAGVAALNRARADDEADEAAGETGAAADGGGTAPLGDLGLVVGATTAPLAAEHGVDLTAGRPPLLAPGYGAQGADVAAMRAGFGDAWERQVLVNASRGILRAGPEERDLVAAMETAREDLDS